MCPLHCDTLRQFQHVHSSTERRHSETNLTPTCDVNNYKFQEAAAACTSVVLRHWDRQLSCNCDWRWKLLMLRKRYSLCTGSVFSNGAIYSSLRSSLRSTWNVEFHTKCYELSPLHASWLSLSLSRCLSINQCTITRDTKYIITCATSTLNWTSDCLRSFVVTHAPNS